MGITARRAAIAVVSFIAGGAVSLGVAAATAGRALTERTAEIQRQLLETRFLLAYRLGDFTAISCEMDRYTRFTAAMSAQARGADRRRILSGVGLSYARLAKAAAASGHTAEHDRAMAVALVTFKEVEPGLTTEAQIEQVLRDADAELDRDLRSCDTSLAGNTP